MGESKALQKGLSAAAIVMIVISAVLLIMSNSVEMATGSVSEGYLLLIAASSVPLLAVLIVLVIKVRSTDTVKDLVASVAVRYAFFGWFYIFLSKIASGLIKLYVTDYLFYEKYYTPVYLFINSFNVCVVGSLVLGLTMRKLPTYKIAKRKLRVGHLLFLIMMMYGMTLAGSIMGLPIHSVLTSLSAEDLSQSVKLEDIMTGSGSLVLIICVGILPAIFEELLFRKFLIDRTIRHGEFISCAMSGIMFGLWHGNFQQFFFAFFIGVLFAFVYIRTGNIIYTMIMHASVNLVTSTITMQLLGQLMNKMGLDGDVSQNEYVSNIMGILLLLLIWIIILISFQITGFVFAIKKRKYFKLFLMEGELKRKEILSSLTHSVEMWVFFSFAILLFLYYYLPGIIANFI